MYLSRVEIKNFRSFAELTVEFQEGLNVLVGRNNTDKTNLLQAIRHALGPSASRGDALWLERDDFFKQSATDETERTIQITLTFSGLLDTQRAHFYEIVDFDLTNLARSTAIVRFEASWPRGKRQATIRRTGGPAAAEAPEIPTKLLESLPITFLPALRDAEAALAPGYRSRLAVLLRELAERKYAGAKDKITGIYAKANADLRAEPLIDETVKSLQSTTKGIAGTDYAASAIKAAKVDFDRILRVLQVQMEDTPIGSLEANGLGYNNLLYIAVILEHLKENEPDESPIFLVEEPEAHLHPQLATLLARYLANETPGSGAPQTVLTTHSPTIAANVPPNRVQVLFTDQVSRSIRCHCISKAGMDLREQNQFQRMMDITRAILYFAKGAILVEGISEALLVPVLAKRLGHDLATLHISVVPICGVAFETFKKLLDPDVLGIPVAIVTDADPEVTQNTSWRDAQPTAANGGFSRSERAQKLVDLFSGHKTVHVECSQVTLEYDLAEAGEDNALVMAEMWEACFSRLPGTFNRDLVRQTGAERCAKALATWRGICRASHSGSKAELAHRLAEFLSHAETLALPAPGFEVPLYLKTAIEYVVAGVTATSS